MNASSDIEVTVEKDEDGWLVGWVVGLPGCHTQAHSLDELEVEMREAISATLDATFTGGITFRTDPPTSPA